MLNPDAKKEAAMNNFLFKILHSSDYARTIQT